MVASYKIADIFPQPVIDQALEDIMLDIGHTKVHDLAIIIHVVKRLRGEVEQLKQEIKELKYENK